jgi:LysR family glycine cleavage system transcriptional activator
MHLPPLKGIVAFEVVARLGSVNEAADELNVTASAVSHQIANLEGFVGRRLVPRSADPRRFAIQPGVAAAKRTLEFSCALMSVSSRAPMDRKSVGPPAHAPTVNTAPIPRR